MKVNINEYKAIITNNIDCSNIRKFNFINKAANDALSNDTHFAIYCQDTRAWRKHDADPDRRPGNDAQGCH